MPPIKIPSIGGMITIININNECLRCVKTITDNDDYQLIFDETGQEMNIKKLLKDCFYIDVDEETEKFQALCEDCLNELIETFDIIELERDINDSESLLKNVKTTNNQSEILTSLSSNNNDINSYNNIKLQEDDNEKNNNDDDDYVYDESYYIIKTEEELQVNLDNNSKEILSELQEIKNNDYIIEDMNDEEITENDILGEYTIDDNENNIEEFVDEPQEELISNNENEVESITEEIQLKEEKELLITDYREENCDDPVEILNNRGEEYEEIDYLDDAIDDITKLNDYMKKSIYSNFKDISFPDEINCCLCNETLDKHSTALDHCTKKHNENDSNYLCVIDQNCDQFYNIDDLSNHLVFKHYDLDTLIVYSQCSFCTKRFNNIITFNKHSCYDNKNTSRCTTECTLCGKHFRSNKRYRFHLQFHLEKHRPKACLICRKFYEDDNELFEHIMYEREPKDALICKICDRNFLQLDTYENHKNVHHLKRPFACKFCDKTYLSGQQLQDHLNAQHLQKNIYKCKFCGKEFFKRNILHKHLLNHKEPVEVSVFSCSNCGFVGQHHEAVKKHIAEVHKNNNNNDLVNILASIQTIAYCCEYCEMAFNTCENLLLHRNTKHEDNLYECQLCTLNFDSFKKAKTHRQTHQKMNDLRRLFPIIRHYVCNIEGCTSNYAQWVALMSHKRNIHLIGKQKPFKCEQCDEGCVNRRQLNQHIQDKHKKTPTFPCPFCTKIYTTPMAIAVHIARMHNNNKLACDHCGTLCKNKDALEKHIINTHEVLTCYICEKVLKNMKNLKTHIKMVHKKEKRYFCQYCKRGYYNNCDRLTHEQAIHLKNKAYTCDICPYTTPYRESIMVHTKNHNNTKPHECNLCQKKFARKYSLTLHQRRHAEVRKFVCPYNDCNSSYPNQGILNLHMRTKHADETTLLSKYVPVKNKKLAKILKKGIPEDYLDEEEDDDITDELIDEINSNSEDIYVVNSENGQNENNINEDNELEENDSNIEYVFADLKNNDDCIDDEQQSNEYNINDDIEDVEIEDIILNENDEHNYILRENGEIETYEIIEN